MQGKITSSMIYYPVPLHLQAAYKDLGMKPGSLPVCRTGCARGAVASHVS